jgi:hypothetical protein
MAEQDSIKSETERSRSGVRFLSADKDLTQHRQQLLTDKQWCVSNLLVSSDESGSLGSVTTTS